MAPQPPHAKWPYKKGPTGGLCPSCGARLFLRFRDHFTSEWYCEGCGYVTTRRGIPNVVKPEAVRVLVNDVWAEIVTSPVRKALHLPSFLKLLDVTCRWRYGKALPTIRKEQFERWGYEIVANWIQRK